MQVVKEKLGKVWWNGGGLAKVSANVISGNLTTPKASSANDRLQPRSWAPSKYLLHTLGKLQCTAVPTSIR